MADLQSFAWIDVNPELVFTIKSILNIYKSATCKEAQMTKIAVVKFVGHVHKYWVWMCAPEFACAWRMHSRVKCACKSISVWSLALEKLVWTDSFFCHTQCAMLLTDELMALYLRWLQGLDLCVCPTMVTLPSNPLQSNYRWIQIRF